ncbi:unnamed protein product, partial [Didymodactylos carnosus]
MAVTFSRFAFNARATAFWGSASITESGK